MVIGNLGKDAELRFTQTGRPVCSFRMATNEQWTKEDGTKGEHTEWHSIVLWGKTAENIAKYLTKGKQVYVEGKLRTRSWEDKEGVTRYTTEIIAQVIQLLGSGNGGNRPPHPAEGDTDEMPAVSIPDEDIPF